SPFMLETCRVISPLPLPAITHVDDSARVQTVSPAANPRFYGLLAAFERLTGCPLLLNTSFNIKGEPIVNSPEDALQCFITTDIDCLVLGDFLIDRGDIPEEELAIFGYLIEAYRKFAVARPGIRHDVYTFM
ncbi:MAG: carbamoyltransferase, partial [Cytophagales bacterium]|nr:carbamoyltransferase [Cytophagales bacterium]